MSSNDDLLHQPHPLQQKPLALFAAVLLIALIAGTGGYFLGSRNTQSTSPSYPSPAPQTVITQSVHNLHTPIPTISSPLSTEISTNWRTFTAPMEGFTLSYPGNWRIEDVTLDNCGHKNGKSDGRGNYCKDSFNFVAPDGLIVRYVIYSGESNDRAGCGTQSVCGTQHIDEIETLKVDGLGGVLLAKSGKTVMLHKPIDSGTMPVIGENKNSNYTIVFSLPTKTGGRFSLFLTPFYSNSKLRDELTIEQYYNQDSVKQGIQILKSLKY